MHTRCLGKVFAESLHRNGSTLYNILCGWAYVLLCDTVCVAVRAGARLLIYFNWYCLIIFNDTTSFNHINILVYSLSLMEEIPLWQPMFIIHVKYFCSVDYAYWWWPVMAKSCCNWETTFLIHLRKIVTAHDVSYKGYGANFRTWTKTGDPITAVVLNVIHRNIPKN
jgi:hypothetical protein